MRSAVNCLLLFLSFSASAAIIGDRDNRQTYASFAASKFKGDKNEFYSKFSGAGVFYCDSSFESASVVKRNDIAVLAAHSVYEKRGGRCVPKSNLGSCYFQVVNKDGSPGRKIPILPKTLRLSVDHQCNIQDMSKDWAIVKLKTPAAEVTPFEPYDVNQTGSPGDGFSRLKGTTVFMTAGRNYNLAGFRAETPTVCEDHLGFVWPNRSSNGDVGFSIGIGCSGGPGNSGGAILISSDGEPLFIGLASGSMGPERDHWPFDNHNFTGGPLLEGEFFDVLSGM